MSGMELAPYSSVAGATEAGCQGVIGPCPSAFLDKRCVKNWRKDNARIGFCKFVFGNGEDQLRTFVSNLKTRGTALYS